MVKKFKPENEKLDTEENIEYSCHQCNFKSENKKIDSKKENNQVLAIMVHSSEEKAKNC